MLRVVVAALALANLGYFGWTQGWLDAVVGIRSIGDREPERLQRQVRPDAVRIVDAAPRPPADATAAPRLSPSPPPSPATACLEAGPYADAELAALRPAAQAGLPAGSWALARRAVPGRWIVYMGRYPAPESLARKVAELQRRGVAFEPVTGRPGLTPGLSLGHYDDVAEAVRALRTFATLGIRTARVVEWSAAGNQHRLRIEAADAALAARLRPAGAAPLGRDFGPCASNEPGT